MLRLLRLLSLSAGLIMMTACGEPERAPLRVGLNSWPGYEFLYLAETLGYFKERGLDVELVTLGSQGDVQRAYERGQVDFAALTLVDALAMTNRGMRAMSIIYAADYSNGGDMLLADAALKECRDLQGKRIALEPSTVDILLVYYALQSCGLSLADVRIVPMSQALMAEALTAGKVDAVETYPPFSGEVLNTRSVNRLFDSSRVPGAILDVLLGDRDTLNGRVEDVAKMLAAFEAARIYYIQHHDAALKGTRERLGEIQAAELDKGFSGITVVEMADQESFLRPGGIIAKALAETEAILMQQGVIQAPAGSRLTTNPDPAVLARKL